MRKKRATMVSMEVDVGYTKTNFLQGLRLRIASTVLCEGYQEQYGEFLICPYSWRKYHKSTSLHHRNPFLTAPRRNRRNSLKSIGLSTASGACSAYMPTRVAFIRVSLIPAMWSAASLRTFAPLIENQEFGEPFAPLRAYFPE